MAFRVVSADGHPISGESRYSVKGMVANPPTTTSPAATTSTPPVPVTSPPSTAATAGSGTQPTESQANHLAGSHDVDPSRPGHQPADHSGCRHAAADRVAGQPPPGHPHRRWARRGRRGSALVGPSSAPRPSRRLGACGKVRLCDSSGMPSRRDACGHRIWSSASLCLPADFACARTSVVVHSCYDDHFVRPAAKRRYAVRRGVAGWVAFPRVCRGGGVDGGAACAGRRGSRAVG